MKLAGNYTFPEKHTFLKLSVFFFKSVWMILFSVIYSKLYTSDSAPLHIPENYNTLLIRIYCLLFIYYLLSFQ